MVRSLINLVEIGYLSKLNEFFCFHQIREKDWRGKVLLGENLAFSLNITLCKVIIILFNTGLTEGILF
jgi:hypothetical protein